ncbi:MAG: hypothetical protein R2716_02325 [Microthrixaceae bacterium]
MATRLPSGTLFHLERRDGAERGLVIVPDIWGCARCSRTCARIWPTAPDGRWPRLTPSVNGSCHRLTTRRASRALGGPAQPRGLGAAGRCRGLSGADRM